MAQIQKKKKGGSAKYGRNKRTVDQKMSAYVRSKISFNKYYGKYNKK